MANVLFKRGLSTALPAVAQDGVFYLTTDTNRLYVGNGTSLEAINKNIVIVDDLNALEKLTPVNTDDFAFVKAGNILAVCIDSAATELSKKWVQLNPDTDTNTDSYISSAEFISSLKTETLEDGTVNKWVEVTYTINQKKENVINGSKTDLTPITGSFTISSSQISDLENPTSVAVKATEIQDNLVRVNSEGPGAAGTGFTIAGEKGVTINAEKTDETNTVIITGTEYDLKLNDTTIKLNNTTTGADTTTSIPVIDDDDWIEVSNDNGKIKIAHASKDVKSTTGTATKLEDEADFTVITGITTDDNNHVTGIEKTTYTIQDTTYTPDLLLDATSHELTIILEDENGNRTNKDTQDISFNITIDGEEKVIYPGWTGKAGADTLPELYSKDEIEGKLRALNSLTYKGIVDGTETHPLPTEGSLGDTYKVSKDFDSYKVGDLLILNGTENNEGIVTSITWDVIHTGESADTTYTYYAADNSLILKEETGSNKYAVQVQGDAQDSAVTDGIISVTAAGGAENGPGGKLYVSHKTFDKAEADLQEGSKVNYGQSLTAVVGIETDGFGHTTGYKTQEFTIPEADTIEANADEIKLTLKDGNGTIQGSVKVSAENELTAEGSSSDNKNLEVIVKHNTVTKADTSADLTPAHNGESFPVVSEITYNDYGHVTGVKTTNITLPEEVTYEINGAAVVSKTITKADATSGAVSGVEWVLKDSNSAKKGDAISLVSESLTTKVAENSVAQIEITWGTF